ncbi:uncharacterized protein F5Z01DRAFT_679460 [Emericellopsis atlantica]|uniref:Monocarboxylate transporter 4 n=1 Tax=Emericellopsis atlantica TaxID=2614577 RepID=A0A9P8CSM3_9HYPO|nr:uncharacterized protein F5Z01DRAFT_679460 [Emericellopsis atlantica]KAG9257355.1 hypothetical protein F5Z01DRAFT_679460 [Emericellopsis atlantica]
MHAFRTTRTLDELDEFVNWGDSVNVNANDALDNVNSTADTNNDAFFPPFEIDPALAGMSMGPGPTPENIDLMLGNVDEDDFSFSAIEHFGATNAGGIDLPALTGNAIANSEMPTGTDFPTDFWETPEYPCGHCIMGGHVCKKIREGRYKGYCTSCIALSIECSFVSMMSGPQPGSVQEGFPINPWPTIGAEHTMNDPKEHPLHRSLSTQSSSTDLANLSTAEETNFFAPKPDGAPPKIGARFSRESVRILKTWLTTHNRHPYPSDEEKEMLQRKTGLSKTQITNWLANARRRGKVQGPRATSPHPSNLSRGIDIPQRRGTPALESMNPLQRWAHSPPEHEPASVSAIARAVTASSSAVSSGLNSPFSHPYTDDGSSRSLCNQSSASSFGTSHSSNGSSAYSHGSRNSFGSFGSAPFNNRGRRRRRRRATPSKGLNNQTELGAPLKTFQCTFCTETFRTKHDWQRHEKSLHLSLERWVCAPHGSRAVCPDTNQLSCVYCGQPNPDDEHLESHNHSTCQERTLEERTFYRKDHLNQHLRLVHNVKFMDWAMKSWKVATPEIRSRCGFCGEIMDTWSYRVDHLAEHFKTGLSMADWKGDWGFENPVLEHVENSIPPYLIHHERTSPFPYMATGSAPETPRNAYELIKLELAFFDSNHREQHGRSPTDEEMAVEGMRIIFASEILSLQGIATQVSWLRDLIFKDDSLMKKARFGPLRGATENRLETLKINGKDNLFEQCPMEFQLHEFVRAKRLLGLTAMDDELQEEACRIVGRVEEVSTHPSDIVANWVLRMIVSSTNWLAPFRRRAHLPRSDDIKDMLIRSTDPTVIDSTIHNYTRLERELSDYMRTQRAAGIELSDEALQRQARIIIYEFDDGWNQTAADNVTWLEAFKSRHSAEPKPKPTDSSPAFSLPQTTASLTGTTPFASGTATTVSPATAMSGPSILDADGNMSKLNLFYLNEANCYRRLSRDLARWVAATMSPNNPARHVPTDAEIQHQARWILYDEDDPWNYTHADSEEWLTRFKRATGILQDGGPLLAEAGPLPLGSKNEPAGA